MSTKENLIDAAKSILWERGYEGMSPSVVQEHSGAGQGSFYHHFKGKRALAAQALEEICAEMKSEFKDLTAGEQGGIDKVRSYLSLPRDGLKGCRLGRLACERSIAEPAIREPVGEYFNYVETELTRMLEEASACGDLPRTLPPGEIAEALVAMVQGGFVLARVHGEPERMDRALRGALALLSHAIQSPAGKSSL